MSFVFQAGGKRIERRKDEKLELAVSRETIQGKANPNPDGVIQLPDINNGKTKNIIKDARLTGAFSKNPALAEAVPKKAKKE